MGRPENVLHTASKAVRRKHKLQALLVTVPQLLQLTPSKCDPQIQAQQADPPGARVET